MATFAEMADFDEAAGKRLRTARERLNLSQFEAAHRLGVSDKTLGKWERAQATPRLRQWAKIEEVYGVTAEEIRGEPEPAQLERIEEKLDRLLAAIQPEQDAAAASSDGADRRPKLRRPASTPQAKPAHRKRRAGS